MTDTLIVFKEVLYIGKEALTFAALMIGLFLSISSHRQTGNHREVPQVKERQ